MLALAPYAGPHLARRLRLLAALALAALFAALLPQALRTPAAPAAAAALRPAALPLIVAPTGNPAVPFGTIGLGAGVAFAPDGLRLELGGDRIAVRFLQARPDLTLVPLDRRDGTISAYGGARSAWRERLPTYAALTYQGLFPGVDLRYDGAGGDLKGTYVVAPHAEPATIRWRYEGASSVALDPASGDLLIGLPGGATLREEAPIAWQDLPGGRTPVAARFALADGVASFQLGAYDPALPLVIDPTLTLGTFLGGSSADYGRGIAVDRQGAMYLVGEFFSSDFLGDNTQNGGSTDVIVLKLNPDGSELIYGSFLKGSGTDAGLAITVNGSGEAFVLADPDLDFPLHNAPIASVPETGDGVLMKFSAAGDLLFSTYLGFDLSTSYTGKAVAVGAGGQVYVTGQTYIAERRLAQVALVEVNPASGAVVRAFDRGDEYVTTDGAAVAVGPRGRIYVTGRAGSPWGQFPTTTDAFQRQCGAKLRFGEDSSCGDNAFLLVVTPELQVEYASYLGGSANDKGRGLAVDGEGNAIIAGEVTSADFPLKNALTPACPADPSLGLCSYDGFVSKLSPSQGLIYSSYIASIGEPEAMTFIGDVAVDGGGNAYIAGFSSAGGLPVKNAVQATRSEGLCVGGFNRFCFDAYVLGLAPDGSLRFGTYLGGKFDDLNQDLAVDSSGALYMAGYSAGSDFPTTSGAIQPAKSASYDFFVARIALDGGTTPTPVPGPELRHRAYLPLVRR